MPRPRKTPPPKSWAAYLTLSTELVAILMIWGILGYLLDRYGETKPWGLLGGLLIGVGHILWRITRL